MFDAIIVGARCAGASTAMLLARAGHKVLLLERSGFPSDTMSTLYIHQPGVALLADWGVLDAVKNSGCPPLDRTEYRVGDVVLSGPAAAFGNITAAYAPRRWILDQILVDAAVRAGACFIDRAAVVGLCGDEDRTTGVRYRAGNGREVTVRGRLVIGADGMRSKVAQLVSAPYDVIDDRMTCVYFTMWQGVRTGFTFYEQTGHWIAVIPTNEDTIIVSTYFPQARFTEVRRAPLEHHLAAVRTIAPELHERLRSGQRVGKVMGTGDQRNFFRRSHGPGWALVGDAGHHLDTITARGITHALQQAALVAGCVGGVTDDEQRLAEGLRDWAERRDAALKPDYASTLSVARLELPQARVEMMRFISQSAELTQRYFAVIAGIVPMEDLFAAGPTEFRKSVPA